MLWLVEKSHREQALTLFFILERPSEMNFLCDIALYYIMTPVSSELAKSSAGRTHLFTYIHIHIKDRISPFPLNNCGIANLDENESKIIEMDFEGQILGRNFDVWSPNWEKQHRIPWNTGGRRVEGLSRRGDWKDTVLKDCIFRLYYTKLHQVILVSRSHPIIQLHCWIIPIL